MLQSYYYYYYCSSELNQPTASLLYWDIKTVINCHTNTSDWVSPIEPTPPIDEEQVLAWCIWFVRNATWLWYRWANLRFIMRRYDSHRSYTFYEADESGLAVHGGNTWIEALQLDLFHRRWCWKKRKREQNYNHLIKLFGCACFVAAL